MYLCSVKFNKNEFTYYIFRNYWTMANSYSRCISIIIIRRKKIPELMRGLGTGIKEFKDATKDEENTDKVEEKK